MPAPHEGTSQLLLPPGRHQGVGRSSDRILRDSQAGGKEAELIIRRFVADPRPTSSGIEALHQHQALPQWPLQGKGETVHGGEGSFPRQQNDPIAQLGTPTLLRPVSEPIQQEVRKAGGGWFWLEIAAGQHDRAPTGPAHR